MLDINLPDINDHVWTDIINGQRTINFDFLAANILTRHMQELYAGDPSQENLKKCTMRLRELFSRNTELLSVQKDIDKIKGWTS